MCIAYIKMVRTIIHRLKVVDQRQDVPVAHGDSLQHRNLIPDLLSVSLVLLRSLQASSPYVLAQP